MKINRIIFISKILTDSYGIRQNIRIKNNFENVVHSVLVVKKSCWNKKCFLKINGKHSVKLQSG